MKRASFKIGQVLEYLGDRLGSTTVNGVQVYTRKKGMRVTITGTKPPSKGYGFIKNDEDGEPIIDHDQDGYNTFLNAAGQGTIIWPEDKNQWKIIS